MPYTACGMPLLWLQHLQQQQVAGIMRIKFRAVPEIWSSQTTSTFKRRLLFCNPVQIDQIYLLD